MLDPISVMSALGGAVAAAARLAPRPVQLVRPLDRQERPTGSDRRDTVELSHAARLFAATTDAGSAERPSLGVSGPGQGAEAQLNERESQELQKLKQRDKEVRAHEQAHRASGGAHAGAISLQFTQGPDGKRYAVEGSVPIDLSPVKGDPAATIRKMQQVQRAALAPAQPSGADRRVATQARRAEQQARSELTAETRKTSTADDEHQSSAAAVDQDHKVDVASAYAAATGNIQQLTSTSLLDLFA